jgi:hypothetical protein
LNSDFEIQQDLGSLKHVINIIIWIRDMGCYTIGLCETFLQHQECYPIHLINAFRDGVSDIKTVEEIAIKKPKTVTDLLTVTDTCIEASDAWAQLLESRDKGPSKKKQDDWEVNMIDQGDRKDRGDCGFHIKQSSDQKEKRPFCRPDDVEKWCEIYRTSGHDLEECKTFLDQKKMALPAAPAPQDARLGEHR